MERTCVSVSCFTPSLAFPNRVAGSLWGIFGLRFFLKACSPCPFLAYRDTSCDATDLTRVIRRFSVSLGLFFFFSLFFPFSIGLVCPFSYRVSAGVVNG